MNRLFSKYKKLASKNIFIFTLVFSLIINILLAVGKALLSFEFGVFFLVSALVNLFVFLAKLQCFLGFKDKKNNFELRNLLIAIFMFVVGIEYIFYMTRLVFTDAKVSIYNPHIAVIIAAISFIEIGLAIRGIVISSGKGFYFRNIKLINLCSALTAIVLTEIALTSFASQKDVRQINGIVGMVVGVIIILISLYIYFYPNFSIEDKRDNNYICINTDSKIEQEEIRIMLTDSKVYANYEYIGRVEENLIKGRIIKQKSPIIKWNIYVKILVILLSEILVFPYAFIGLIKHFKRIELIDVLNNKMNELGYKKI